MKRIITIALVVFCANFANAQFADNHAIYSTFEANLGNYVGMDANLNYVLNQKYAFKIGYSDNLRIARSKPEDFTTGVVGILVFGASNPFDQLENLQATVGRIFKLNPSGTIRANLSVGAGYTTVSEPEN